MIAKVCSKYLESCAVKGDKITIHKCVIDKAIKMAQKDIDPFMEEERKEGRLDILIDIQETIRIGMEYEKSYKSDT